MTAEMNSRGHAASVSVGITGASGVVYGLRLCEELLRMGKAVNLVVSRNGEVVLKEECEVTVHQVTQQLTSVSDAVTVFEPDRMDCALASGSGCDDIIIVCPCSLASLAKIRSGDGDHLVHRMADVGIKEGKRVVLAPRETPLSVIHLENMLGLARLGVRIVPPCPAFYHRPKDVSDMVSFVVARVLQAAGIRSALLESVRYQ